jgi:beta-lactamase class A
MVTACGSGSSPAPASVTGATGGPDTSVDRLKSLEQQHHARLGLVAIDTVTGATVRYRADERFPMDSSFKGLACGVLLREHPLATGYFDRVVPYAASDVLADSPITRTHADTGMTVAELCEAAITVSDNTAANLLLRELGGPAGWTAGVRALGDSVSRLDRWETELNSSIPGDPRDTTTPAAMAADYGALLQGPALAAPERDRLSAWMLGNKVGAARIRAGVPAGWQVADKTGTGTAYGSAIDAGVVRPPDGGHPIALAILTTHDDADAKADEPLIAAAAKIAVDAVR